MIFDVNKEINESAIDESTVDAVLENIENVFKYETMAEATSIVVAEQETNWNRFMNSIGLSELEAMMEGTEIIYEGARLEKFIGTAKKYFEKAIQKLGQLTKAFIEKVKSIDVKNQLFLKRYLKKLQGIKNTVTFNGYTFSSELDSPKSYDTVNTTPVTASNAENIVGKKDDYSKEKAQEKVCKEAKGEDFKVAVHKHLFGEKKESSFDITKQIAIIKGTKSLQSSAKSSYKFASKRINDIIKELDKAEREAKKNDAKTEGGVKIESAISVVLSYWKSYSTAVMTYHGEYMSALAARNAQAKAICVKALKDAAKVEPKKDETTKQISSKNEGFVDTDVFLGGVEFI